MVIVVDEKLPPPPPYSQSPSPVPLPRHLQTTANSRRQQQLIISARTATFTDLPPHILLHIVYATFPNTPHRSHTHFPTDPSELVQHRQILYWIQMSLRLVNKSTYIACMNVLRSVYLPSYQSFVRPGYSSDPFPLSVAGDDGGNGTAQRETAVLDLFIAAKVREDVWLDETELHLEREETFKDLFDLSQPRARIEDLIRHYGTLSGSIYTTPPPTPDPFSSSPATPTTPSAKESSSSPSTPTAIHRGSLPFHSISVSFSPRTVGVVLFTGGRKRSLTSIQRHPSEKLETVAKRLVKELDHIRAGASGGRGYGG